MSERPMLMVATPAYAGQVHYRYMFSVLNLVTAGLTNYIFIDPWAALVTISRNDAITFFYQEHKKWGWTHLLWLDADVAVDVQGVQRLLSHGVDAVAARVPIKAFYRSGQKYSVRNVMGQEGKLLVVEAAACGCFLLSKKAALDLCEKAKREGRVYKAYNTEYPEYYREVFDVFRVGVRGEEYDTEDWWMCHELQELGYKVYVDPAVVVEHYGTHGWVGEPLILEEVKKDANRA